MSKKKKHYEKIYCCLNNYILYGKQYEDLNECPNYGASRWSANDDGSKRVNVTKKVMTYFSPISHFNIMFQNVEMTNNLTWHANK